MLWLDLSAHGVHLCPYLLSSQKYALTLLGAPDAITAEQRRRIREELHFEPTSVPGFYMSMHYNRPDKRIGGISFQAFKSVFPEATRREMGLDEAARPMIEFIEARHAAAQNKSAQDNQLAEAGAAAQEIASQMAPVVEAQMEQPAAVSDVMLDSDQMAWLGLNHEGLAVYQTATGRVIRTSKEESQAVYEIEKSFDEPKFLRGVGANGKPKLSSIARCAEGFVHGMTDGGNLKAEDVARFIDVVMEPGEFITLDPTVNRSLIEQSIHRAIDIATIKRLFHRTAKGGMLDKQLIEEILSMQSRRPAGAYNDVHPALAVMASRFISGAQQQLIFGGVETLSSVLPLALVGGNKRVYINTPSPIWQQINLAATDLLEKSSSGVEQELPPFATNADVTITASHAADFLMATYRSEKGSGTVNGIPVYDAAHARAMIAMQKLRESGVAIITVPADEQAATGRVTTSREFLSWVYDNYNVAATFDINSLIYDGGVAAATRVIVLNGRRMLASDEIAPEVVRVCDSWDAVFHEMTIAQLKIYDPQASVMLSSDLVVSMEESLARIKMVDNEIAINDYQARYITMSTSGEVDALIPVNMQYPQQLAFMRYQYDPLNRQIVMNERGDATSSFKTIEESLAHDLAMDIEDINSVFSPEQKDGIALAIWRHKNGKPFLFGDATGLGKGRELAGFARYQAVNGQKVMFFTRAPELINDFWRDVRDINADRGQFALLPYIVNKDAVIYDADRQPLFTGDDARNNLYIENSVFPPHANCLMTTYWQISRYSTHIIHHRAEFDEFGHRVLNSKLKPTPRIDWLIDIAKEATIISDESHEASGKRSNMGDNMRAIIDNSKGVIYSSATFAANEKKLMLYRDLFPGDMDIDELESTLTRGGEYLQEVMSAMLVADGAMISRNHDLSTMIRTIRHSKHAEHNHDLNNRFADVMMSLNVLIKEINLRVDDFNLSYNNQNAAAIQQAQQRAAKIQAAAGKATRMSTRPFGVNNIAVGSVLQNICRQFVLAINAEELAEDALQALRNGQKPVIYMQQTGESLLKQIIANQFVDTQEDSDDDDELNSLTVDLTSKTVRMPLFADAMNRMVDNVMGLKKRLVDGSVIETDLAEIFPNKQEYKKFTDALFELRALIQEFGALPFSPFDTIRQRLEKEGVFVGELSGRQYMLCQGHDGNEYVSRKNALMKLRNGRSIAVDDGIAGIDAFNNGGLDVTLMSASGAVGYSMHSSSEFKDQRQRKLILGETPNNVILLLQVLGRVWRRNQVNKPELMFTTTDIPAEYRVCASVNQNLAKMSAQTSANRDSFARLENKYDLLNKTGDYAAYLYLSTRPDMLDRLGFKESDLGEFKLDGEVAASTIKDLSKKLSARLVMLHTDEQEQVYKDLEILFDGHNKELELSGLSTSKGLSLDYRMRQINRYLISGVEADLYTSEFDRPVYASVIEYKAPLHFLSADEVKELVDSGLKMAKLDPRLKDAAPDDLMNVFYQTFQDNRQDHLRRVVRRSAFTDKSVSSMSMQDLDQHIHNLLIDGKQKWLEKEVSEYDTAMNAVKNLVPGNIFEFEGKQSVITKVILPTPGNECNIFMYRVTFSTPGHESETRNLAAMTYGFSGIKFTADIYDDFHPLRDEFDAVPAGQYVTMHRTVLMGNMFTAASIASGLNSGRACSISDHSGVWHQCMLMPETFKLESIMKMPLRISDPALASEYLLSDSSHTLLQDRSGKSSTVRFSINYMTKKAVYNVAIPKIMLTETILERMHMYSNEVKSLKSRGSMMDFRVDSGRIKDVLALIYSELPDLKIYSGNGGLRWFQDRKMKEKELHDEAMKKQHASVMV